MSITKSLRALFSIYPGEEKNAFQFALLGFLWSFAISLGWRNADALFLLNVGAESLPTSYVIIACAMIVIASGMIYAFHVYATHRIFLGLLGIGVCFYVASHLALQWGIGAHAAWPWYTFRIFGWILYAVANTTFWTFLDQFYHLRDAKRLFCLFTSAIFIGIALTGIVMRSGLIEFRELTLIIAATLLLAMGWIMRIVKKVQPIHSEYDIDAAPAAPEEASMHLTLSAIRRSPFALGLMAFNFLLFITIVLTEYNYMFAFEATFGGGLASPAPHEERAALTLFLGQCIAFASCFNLLFGLLVYSRLLRRFGLGTLLLISPLLLILTYTGWPFSATLFFPLMAFFVSESTFYVIDDNNFNLLLNGVPTKLKPKIRIFIESFFEPVGTLISAVLLSFVALESWLLALFAATCLFVAGLLLRSLYPKAICRNLMDNAIHFEKTPKEWLPSLSRKERKFSEARLLAILKMGDLKAQEFALEGLIDFDDPTILDKLLALLDQASAQTKVLFIEKLTHSSFSYERSVLERLITWEQEAEAELKATLHLFLAKQGLLSPQKALLDLKTSDPKLVSAALIALKRSAAFSSPYTTAELRTLAAQHLQELLGSEDEESILMGLRALAVDATPEDVNILIPYLSASLLPVARQAALIIAEIATPESAHHAPKLLEYLQTQTDSEFRLSLLKALGKMEDSALVYEILAQSLSFRPNEKRQIEKSVYQMGLRNVPTLLSILKDHHLQDQCRLLAGKILGRLALSQLRANLIPIISQEIERAFFYFYHYHTIQEAYPQHKLQVLRDALLTSYHSVMDFIIQLLGVAGEVEDSEILSRSMRSSNPKVRSQVIETLEKTCDTDLFRLLQGLVDEVPLPEKLRAYPKRPLTLEELLNRLRASSSQVDQIAAAAISSALQLPGWRETLKQQMVGKGDLFQHFAYEALEG